MSSPNPVGKVFVFCPLCGEGLPCPVRLSRVVPNGTYIDVELVPASVKHECGQPS